MPKDNSGIHLNILKSSYIIIVFSILITKLMVFAKTQLRKNIFLTHPLPKVGEILFGHKETLFLRSDVRNGQLVRTALLTHILR